MSSTNNAFQYNCFSEEGLMWLSDTLSTAGNLWNECKLVYFCTLDVPRLSNVFLVMRSLHYLGKI